MHSESTPIVLNSTKLSPTIMNRTSLTTLEKPIHREYHQSSFNSSATYKQAIVEIYESLYHFQRERTDEQEAQVIDCISKWYEFNAVFENPFIRANGIESIVNQFSMMSLIPGHIWSELGDVCESEDYDGNRVVVFSHTLHFNLLSGPESEMGGSSYVSVPPTPHAGTPNTTRGFGSFHSAILSRLSLGPAVTLRHPVRVKKAGSDTKWPISWLISHLSPWKMTADMARFDLKLSTRLQFNEQARIVIHEDTWGLKELLECLAPSMWNQVYSLQRWLVGLCGNFISKHYLRSSTRSSKSTSSSTKPTCSLNRIQFSELQDPLEHPNPMTSCLHSPILIGTHHHHKPMDRTESLEDSVQSLFDTPSPINPDLADERNSDEYGHTKPKWERSHLLKNPKNLTNLLDPLGHPVDGGHDEDEDDDAQNTSEEIQDDNLRPSSYFLLSSSSSA